MLCSRTHFPSPVCVSSAIPPAIPSFYGHVTFLHSSPLFLRLIFMHPVLPCTLAAKHLYVRKLCFFLPIYCLLLPIELKLAGTNTWLSSWQLIVLELWSQQVLKTAGCRNAERSLGGCNCQVTVGVVPRGLFKVVLWHGGGLQQRPAPPSTRWDSDTQFVPPINLSWGGVPLEASRVG